ncbi:hypothetical protein KAI04_03935 [Candidatus Pacearchaeota archaeon]|nr:hypothetical protein [Candidatus Pacearchaeota archaeon]
MVEDKNSLEEIYMIERKRAINGTLLEEKQLCVKCESIKDAEKIFDKKWKQN